ncbi:MAG TPA: hypothetical protein VI895_01180 [Bdellovibrionota bacterium]|nr:hypothetical protein [Bdellovibrionota bacterium]
MNKTLWTFFGTLLFALTTSSASEVTYTALKDWIKESPSSSMRRDQYRLPGSKGAEDATLSVFYFPGTGGSVDSNLQRWYGQFQKKDGSPVTGPETKKEIKANDLPVTIIYVTGTYLESQSPMMTGGPVEKKPGYAMLAAIAESPSGPWFFKATGPQATIDRWRSGFEQFAKTFEAKK